MRLVLLVFFLFIPSFARAMGSAPTQMSQSPLIGSPAPDAVLDGTDGKSGSIMASRQNQKAILIFWATWCPHCYEELGYLNANFAAIEKKGIKILLVDMGERREDVKGYFNQRKMDLPSFVDENSVLQGPYRLIGIPTIVFIDDKGIIRNVVNAFPPDYENYFK